MFSLHRALIVALAAYALLAWRFDFLCDDAYITFRYSRHLSEGLGLVYNPGRELPVEGYSNFLWAVVLAACERIGLGAPLGSKILSIGCGAALIAAVVKAAQRMGVEGFGLYWTALFFATLPPVGMWATGGLAAMPVALCVFLAWERLLGDPDRPRGVQAGVFALIAGLLRADGALFVLMPVGAGLLLWLVRGRSKALGRALAALLCILVAGIGTHVAWRYATYGDYLPNTARVKAGFSPARLERGLDYLVTWLLILPSATLVLVFALRRWPADLAHVWLPAATILTGSLGYAVWVGGDFMPFGRFLFAAIPFLALLLAGLWTRPNGGVLATAVSFVAVSLSLLACFDVNVAPQSFRERFHFRQDRQFQSEVERWAEMNSNAEEWVVLGRALGYVTEPGEWMIAGAIGAIGYYSQLQIYDEYGLVTPEVVENGVVRETSSPGHDIRVQSDFFFDKTPKPIYLGSTLVPGDSPPDFVVAGWDGYPWAPLVTIEAHPLAPVDVEAGDTRSLRLLRFR